jgi:hypothetical protein
MVAVISGRIPELEEDIGISAKINGTKAKNMRPIATETTNFSRLKHSRAVRSFVIALFSGW